MDKELKALYDKLGATVNREAHLMTISSDTLKINGSPNKVSYNICSSCYTVIHNTWDHPDWCELYKQEPLAKWLEKGQTNT